MRCSEPEKPWVCGSAQTTGGLGVTFKPFKGFRIGADWTFGARNYSDYFLDASSSLVQNGEITLADPWEIPWGNELDLSCSYSFKIGGLNATVYRKRLQPVRLLLCQGCADSL